MWTGKELVLFVAIVTTGRSLCRAGAHMQQLVCKRACV